MSSQATQAVGDDRLGLCCCGLYQCQRIVHCDLKPENILLREENRLAVVLIDFGSSCYQDQTLYTYIQASKHRRRAAACSQQPKSHGIS